MDYVKWGYVKQGPLYYYTFDTAIYHMTKKIDISDTNSDYGLSIYTYSMARQAGNFFKDLNGSKNEFLSITFKKKKRS